MAMRAAVLDACVLFPEWLRDLILRCAEAGLIRVAWTDEILEETRRNLESDRGLTPQQTSRLLNAMSRAFPDALVEGCERHIPSMTNDPKDRHVMAAAYELALEEGAAVVVTANARDFPATSWPPGVTVVTPDELLCTVLKEDDAAVVDILWSHAQSRKRPPVSMRELLDGLRVHAPRFVDAVLRVVSVRTDAQLTRIAARVRSAVDSTDELRVALEDRLLVDDEYATRFSSVPDSAEFSTLLATVLSDESLSSQLHGQLVRVGLTLSVDALRKLTTDELREVLERLWNDTQ
ncbi:MAG: PIN domain-containing protein [Archangium sp.]